MEHVASKHLQLKPVPSRCLKMNTGFLHCLVFVFCFDCLLCYKHTDMYMQVCFLVTQSVKWLAAVQTSRLCSRKDEDFSLLLLTDLLQVPPNAIFSGCRGLLRFQVGTLKWSTHLSPAFCIEVCTAEHAEFYTHPFMPLHKTGLGLIATLIPQHIYGDAGGER
jgi:hypothetical protein